MNTKDVLLKYICPCVLVLAVIAGILLYVFLPSKEENVDLTVFSHDISVGVGEEQELEYQVSNPYAVVTFEIDNENVANIVGRNIMGLSVGSTQITVTARYKSDTASNVYSVTVSSNSLPPETNEPDNEHPDDSGTSPEEPDITLPNDGYISVDIKNAQNCSVSGNIITVDAGETAKFSLSSPDFGYWIDCKFLTSGRIAISQVPMALSYELVAYEDGVVFISYDNKTIAELTIKIS